MTGSARRAEEARARRVELMRRSDLDRTTQMIETKRRKARAQIEALEAELAADEMELGRVMRSEEDYIAQAERDRLDMSKSRRA